MKFKKYVYEPFFRMGMWLAERYLKPKSAKYQKLERELAFVNGGRQPCEVQEYAAHKAAKMLFVLFWGGGICILAGLSGVGGQSEVFGLERPSYGQDNLETELAVQIEGEEQEQNLSLTLDARKYTDEEAKAILDKVKETLLQMVRGNNVSLMEVKEDLSFPTSFENGAVTAEWFTNPADMLDTEGKIVGEAKENGTEVEILVNLECQELTEEYRFSVRIFPETMTDQEAFLKKIKEKVETADEEGIADKELLLPSEMEGKKLHWKTGSEPTVGILAVMVLLTAVCMVQAEDEKLKKQAQEKRMGLLMEYPAFLYKLTALLRAGLTIQAAFGKIAENYKKTAERKDTRKSYVCEEVLRCCNEMNSGVAQAKAYENFGRRCQLPEYIKIGSVLSQNLKKGSDGLADMLEAEALQGMEGRRNLAKKLGEQAGTKLLFPMMLMLVIVMIILMVPAMLSFSMG